MTDFRYFLYEIEYYIYLYGETLLFIAYGIMAGALVLRAVRRRPMEKSSAVAIAAAHFLLAGSVRFANSYWYSSGEAAVQFIIVLFSSVVLYRILVAGKKGRKKEFGEGRSAAADSSAGMSRVDLKNPWRLKGDWKPDVQRRFAGRMSEMFPAEIKEASRQRMDLRETAWDRATFRCSECGATLLDRSAFCYKCGNVINRHSETILNGETMRSEDI